MPSARPAASSARAVLGPGMPSTVKAAPLSLSALLPALPHVEILSGVVIEALGAGRGEPREDLVSRIAETALAGVVAMAEHADAGLAAVGHAAQRLVLVGELGDLELDPEDPAQRRHEL